jgi:cell division protein ZapE
LKRYCKIHPIDGHQDHRLRQLHRTELFLASNDPSTEQRLQQLFDHYARSAPTEQQLLEVAGRCIPCRAYASGIAWFSFEALCDGPRSQLDYIALADRFEGLIISDIPALHGNNDHHWVVQGTEDRPASATNQRRFLGRNDDLCRRFISLIDELYDRSVMLIASCHVDISQLYPDGALAFAFERTRSRLQEMQSLEYLQRQRRG